MYESVHSNHVTLKYATDLDKFWDEHELKEGSTFQLSVIECKWDSTVQAVSVKLPDSIVDVYERNFPHITISTVKGVSPGRSEEMLGGSPKSKSFNKAFEINVRLEEFEFGRRAS